MSDMKYYDYPKLFSYNRRWNFVITARGYGKTFGMRKQILNDFRKRKELFCEIVRTKDEIGSVASNYFSKVQKLGYYAHYSFEYEMKNRTLYAIDNRFDSPQPEVIGYIVALTEEQFLKKISNSAFVDGDRVRRFIMDEAIIEKKDRYHRYNKREWEIINGIISTVTRETPDNPSKASVYFFGNAVDLSAPLFEALGVDKVPTDYGYYFYGDNVLLHYAEPINQEGFETNTLSGQALAGTAEGQKLFGNVFEGMNDNIHIEHNPKQAKFWRGFIYNGQKFGLWIDFGAHLVHVTSKVPRNQECYALTYEDGTIDYQFLKTNSRQVRQLGELFYKRLLRFEDIQTREKFADMCLTLGLI